MSETKYESKITSAPCSAQQIYRVLSNMQNLDRVKDLIPKDKIQEMEIEPDCVRLKVDGLGQKSPSLSWTASRTTPSSSAQRVFRWTRTSGFR